MCGPFDINFTLLAKFPSCRGSPGSFIIHENDFSQPQSQITVVIFRDISMESLNRFIEIWKGRKRSDTRIHYKFPPKLIFLRSPKRGKLVRVCVSRMNYVFRVERFWVFCYRDDKRVIVQVFARFRKISGLVWSHHGYFGLTYGLAKIQTIARPNCTITYNNYSRCSPIKTCTYLHFVCSPVCSFVIY